MDYVAITTDDYLEHHGILGQKWGIRRYQNKDGSLTAAGRQKYTKFDSNEYKQQRKEELEKEGIKGLKQKIQVNNESYLLSKSDKLAYKSLIKQENLQQKIKDASELGDSKQFNKLLKKWVNYQRDLRFDEILQDKDKIEPLAKAYVKANAGSTLGGLLGGFIGASIYAMVFGGDYMGQVTENSINARMKAEKDAEEYKKQFK